MGRCPARAAPSPPPTSTASTPQTSAQGKPRRRLLQKLLPLIEVSLERSSPADVQGDAMEPTAHHLEMPKFQRDYIEPLPLQEFYESRLIPVDHDHIRIDAECIHIDPVAADAFGQIVGIVPVRILHRWTVNDLPLLQDFGQGIVVDTSRVAEDQAGAQGHKGRVDVAAIITILEEMNPKFVPQHDLYPIPSHSITLAPNLI